MTKKDLIEIEQRARTASGLLIMGNAHLKGGSYDLIQEGRGGIENNIHVAYIPHKLPYAKRKNRRAGYDARFFLNARQDVLDLVLEVRCLQVELKSTQEAR